MADYTIPVPLRNVSVPVSIKVSRSVHSYADRDSIPAEERVGEFLSYPVYVEAKKEFFILAGGITNGDWQIVDFINGGIPGETSPTSWIDPPVDEVVDTLPATPEADYRVILSTDNSIQEYVASAWVPQVGPGSDVPLADGMAVVVRTTSLGLNRLFIYNAESLRWEDKGAAGTLTDTGRYVTNYISGQRHARNNAHVSDLRTITQSGFYTVYDPITNGPDLDTPLPPNTKKKVALLQVISRNAQTLVYIFYRIYDDQLSVFYQSCYASTYTDWVKIGSQQLVAAQILAATTKATPAEADVFGYVNSAETENGQLRKFTWANQKASLKTYFDGIYSKFFPTTSGDGSKFLSDAGDYREAGGSGTIPISPSVATRNEAGYITKNIVTVSEGVTIESRFNYADGIMTFFEIKNQVTGEWKRVTINYTEAVYTSKTVEIIEAWTI